MVLESRVFVHELRTLPPGPRQEGGTPPSIQTLLTGVGSDMSLEVKGVVETLPTVCAEVPLDVIVTLHVPIQHALVSEGLLADVTGKKVSIWTVTQGHL